jgi:endonuclease YncB( thermonuclease family)
LLHRHVIAAPERHAVQFHVQQPAKESLSALLSGKEVDVRWPKHDRYDRLVGKVMVASPDCRATTCPRTLDAGWTRPWQYEKQRGTQA